MSTLPIQEKTRLADRLEALDKEVLAWAKLTRKKLLYRLLELGVEDKIKLARSVSRIRSRTNSQGKRNFQKEPFLTKSLSKYLRKKNSEIEAVAFSFVQHGIFIEHGVGRGRPVGSSQAARYKKAWLSAILPDAVQDLADIMEEKYADIAAAELRILIPGVIDTRIQK